jgi:hypothetical protein
LISGSTFYWDDNPANPGGYHGNTDVGRIDFETGSQLGGKDASPYINIFHEVGHLIDMNLKYY